MSFPFLGFGLGLRTQHYTHILEHWPQVDWFEAISENYMVPGGKPLHILDQIRERYPVLLHGVSLSIGSTDPLNQDYLKALKMLIKRINPPWVSDHLCWTGVHGHNLHDLLPLPYTEETLCHVTTRIRQVQDFLERPLVIENVSSYMEFEQSTMSEWEFVSRVAQESGCYLLFDVNNVYVSSQNHNFDPMDYLHAMPKDRVVQFHLAGHSQKEGFLLDTHDHPVKSDVWALYAQVLEYFGPISTMIERDDNIPPFPELEEELGEAKRIYGSIAS
jgi:uncharacterized protein